MNNTFSDLFKNAAASNNFGLAIEAVRNNQYIVGTMDSEGKFSISSRPVIHKDHTSAKEEAHRLAALNHGMSYIVLRFIGGALVPKVVGLYEF